MSRFLSLMRDVQAGCVLADRAHASELLQAVGGFNEEWLHWAELFVQHEGVELLLLFFNNSGAHSFEQPFAVFVAKASGLEFGLDVALGELPGEKTCWWAFLADEAIRTRVHEYLQAHHAAIGAPYRWDEQRRLH